MMKYATLATQMMVLMGVAVWGGYKLDQRLHWKVPVMVILLPSIALVITLWSIIKEFNKRGNEK